MKRSSAFALLGVGMGMVSPAGDALVRWWLYHGRSPLWAWLASDLRSSQTFYAYSTILTTLVLATAGFLVGRAFERVKKRSRELERASLADPLTGLHNRRSLFGHLERELARSARRHSPLACLMVDIDGFKAINDLHGHAAGDEVLKEIASRLSRSSRAADLVGRYGGDEFAVILPDADAALARQTAERLRLAVEAEPLRIGALELSPRVSIGAAEKRPGMRRPEELLEAADRALYDAKRAGRNRVALR